MIRDCSPHDRLIDVLVEERDGFVGEKTRQLCNLEDHILLASLVDPITTEEFSLLIINIRLQVKFASRSHIITCVIYIPIGHIVNWWQIFSEFLHL